MRFTLNWIGFKISIQNSIQSMQIVKKRKKKKERFNPFQTFAILISFQFGLVGLAVLD